MSEKSKNEDNELKNKKANAEEATAETAQEQSDAPEKEEMTDEEGTPVMSAPHPEQILMLRTDLPLKKYDMLRKASKQ